MTMLTTHHTVTMSSAELERIAELLEICDGFFRRHPNVAADLDELLVDRGLTGGPGWLIDGLGFSALDLWKKAARRPASTPLGTPAGDRHE